jgi:hypothetical protein
MFIHNKILMEKYAGKLSQHQERRRRNSHNKIILLITYDTVTA